MILIEIIVHSLSSLRGSGACCAEGATPNRKSNHNLGTFYLIFKKN
jgi:hypothetical protein